MHYLVKVKSVTHVQLYRRYLPWTSRRNRWLWFRRRPAGSWRCKWCT